MLQLLVTLKSTCQKEKDYSLRETLGIGGLLDRVVSRPDVKKYNQNLKLADIYINPRLPDYDASSFGNKNAARMMQIGEKAALKVWPQLMKLRERLATSD